MGFWYDKKVKGIFAFGFIAIAALCSLLFSPPAHAAGEYSFLDSVFQQQGSGVAVCLDNTSPGRCKVLGNDLSVDDFLAAGSPIQNDQITLVAINKTGSADFWSDANRGGGKIHLAYNKTADTFACTYQFIDDGQWHEPLDCGYGKGGNPAWTAHLGQSAGSFYVLDLAKLCIADDDGTGYDCTREWNDQPSSLNIAGFGDSGGILFCKNAAFDVDCYPISPGSFASTIPFGLAGELSRVSINRTSTVYLKFTYQGRELQIKMSYDKPRDNFLCYYDINPRPSVLEAYPCTTGAGVPAASAISRIEDAYVVDLNKLCYKGTELGMTDCGNDADLWNDRPTSYNSLTTFTNFSTPPPFPFADRTAQGDGVWLCDDQSEGGPNCYYTGQPAEVPSVRTLGAEVVHNDSIDWVIVDTTADIILYNDSNYGGTMLNVKYQEGENTLRTCSYQTQNGPDEETDRVWQECSTIPGSIRSWTNADGELVFAVRITEFCQRDDNLDGKCSDHWAERLGGTSAFKILRVGEESLIPPAPSPIDTTGSYACIWQEGRCVVDEANVECQEGFVPDTTRCGDIRDPSVCGTTENLPCTVSLGLAEKIQSLYFWVVSLAGLVALGLIIFGGVMYAASGGNPSRISEAKSWITHALAGLGMLLAAYLILGFINPDLTKLQDIFLRVNVNPQAPGLELGEGGGGALVGEDCSGFYVSSSPGDRQMLVKQGNFGDPECEYADSILSDGGATFKNAVYLALQYKAERVEGIIDGVDYVDQRAVDILYNDVIPEESGFYPNAVLLRSDNPNVPQPTGAWGMLQMGASEAHGRPDPSQYDIGDVEWSRQVDNAILRLSITDRCRVYWSTWPGWSEDPKKSRPIYRGCPSETNPQIPI